MTNEAGYYILKVEAQGRFHIQFSHIGYQTELKEVVFSKDTKEILLDITMGIKFFEINTVVITNSFIENQTVPIGTIKSSYLTSMSSNNLGWKELINVDGANEKYNWGISALGKL